MDIDRLEALARAATPGPWHKSAHDDRDNPTWDVWCEHHHGDHILAKDLLDADVEFVIATDPSTTLELVDRARRTDALEREKEDLERQVASLTGALITEGRLLDPRDVAATAESHGLSIFKTANQRNNMRVSAEGVLTDALNTILIGAICSPTTER